ncbi:MAG: peptidoglycan recognition family protein, partial [Bacteroidota bacterium]
MWNPAASCNYSSRSQSISAVTVHTTQGSYAGTISWFKNCSAGVSAHYVLRSSDGQVTQMVLESKKAWHVGSENGYTIGLEHEGYISQSSWYTTAMYQSSANLVKDICNSGYGINPTTCWNGASCNGTCLLSSTYRIKGHQHYPNQSHTDPGQYWNWGTYYNLINGGPPPPPPANDNCSAAQTLTPNTTCVSTSGDLVNATTSGLAKASCDASSSSSLNDVWYKFTATATSHTITLTPSSGLDGVLGLYTSCNGGQIGCSDNGGGKGGVEKITATGLTVGSTYFLRVYPYG